MPLINALKGALIGVALVIPGLSGSIFAVIVGLYEPLLAAIAQFKKDWRQAIGFYGQSGLALGSASYSPPKSFFGYAPLIH